MFGWRASTHSGRACGVITGVSRTSTCSCVEEELRSGIPFDPVIKDSASFALERRHHSPFYENVSREGIAV